LYWQIGKTISLKVQTEAWGKGVVSELARYIAQNDPEVKGFSDKNLWRMKQFYETYQTDEKLMPLVRELPWTHNTIIFSRCKTPEEREYYLNLCRAERYSSRELDRQINASQFERAMMGNSKLSAVLRELHPSVGNTFKDSYVLEFLGLSALVAFELKIGKFMPEQIGQLNFYLEALDRDVKKPHENPSIGVLLCRDKDDEVVEYALSRNLSPTLIAQYQLQLPDKKLIQAKLHELFANEAILDWEMGQGGES
jgi:predicted nuclease of restriction endonuclease-like (RecB) superfamily